ncbi:MAG: TetR/AcrR family transcriptional regulator [Firmicutes bacterium]|nr:TetR/AcrR family transcriptional regulator [Bacillota bacterium]
MGTKERRAREKAARKEQVLQAAREVFAWKGFEGATVEEIAARAELSKGAVYLYFRSKEEIFLSMWRSTVDFFVEQAEQALNLTGGLVARFAALLDVYIGLLRLYPDFIEAILNWKHGDLKEKVSAETYEAVVVRCLHVHASLLKVLEDGMREGLFRRVDAPSFITMILGAFNGVLLMLKNPEHQKMALRSQDEVYSFMRDYFLTTLLVK